MRNEGSIDRVIRVLAGAGLGAASWFSLGLENSEPLGIAAAVVGGVLILTGLVGFCPAYRLLGIRTCKVKSS